MAGDLQPNESQCRECEAESSVVSGRTAIYVEGNRTPSAIPACAWCVYGVPVGGGRMWASAGAGAGKAPEPERERKRAKTAGD